MSNVDKKPAQENRYLRLKCRDRKARAGKASAGKTKASFVTNDQQLREECLAQEDPNQ